MLIQLTGGGPGDGEIVSVPYSKYSATRDCYPRYYDLYEEENGVWHRYVNPIHLPIDQNDKGCEMEYLGVAWW